MRQAIRLAEAALDAAGVEESVADARLLLGHALGASPTWVFAHDGDPVAPGWAAFRELIRRRCAREPLQHLTGRQDFWSQRFETSPAALIPRPETELLVELVARALSGRERARIADVGTGTGCVALSLASEVPGSRLVAGDVSPEALALARRNAAALGLDDRVTFVEGALAEPLRAHAPFDAIAANLPYVTEDEWAALEPEVRDHEPRLALVGGPRGTELIEQLAAEALELLRPGGVLALEIGATQGDEVAQRLRALGYAGVEVHRDLTGHERVVLGARPKG